MKSRMQTIRLSKVWLKGRINKELKEICLLDQVYVKAEDGKQSVSAYVASVAKENNANIKIKGICSFWKQAKVSKRRTKTSQQKLQHS